MAKITSSGPNPIPLLKQLVDLTRNIEKDNSTVELEAKMDKLIEAIKEITDR